MRLEAKTYNQEMLVNCNKCQLNSCKTFSWGDEESNTVFIGINPTHTISEDRICFKSGTTKPLFQAIKEAGKKSSSLFFTNLIRCSTPDNRPPTKEEINNCSGILQHDLLTIKPKNIVCLGKVVGKALYGLEKMYSQIELKEPFETTVHLIPHPTYVNRFPKNYEKYKEYIGRVLHGSKI